MSLEEHFFGSYKNQNKIYQVHIIFNDVRPNSVNPKQILKHNRILSMHCVYSVKTSCVTLGRERLRIRKGEFVNYDFIKSSSGRGIYGPNVKDIENIRLKCLVPFQLLSMPTVILLPTVLNLAIHESSSFLLEY
jgi:hypothetical protein